MALRRVDESPDTAPGNAGLLANQELAPTSRTRSLPRLQEVDLVRAVTAICVVGVHSTYFTAYLNSSAYGYHMQNGVVAALHFTREVFLTITAFVMVYVYADRRFYFGAFWRKRGLGVLLPYIFWSLVYVWLQVPHDSLTAWLLTALTDAATGTASYQLYFILLSIEFYLVLPGFLWLMWTLGRAHPWPLLAGSALLQIVLLYADHNYIQVGALSKTGLGQAINSYQASFLPLYEFYAVLGGVAALHVGRLRPFVAGHGRLIVAFMGLGLAALWLRFGVAVLAQGQGEDYATSVLQPVMVPYSVAVALFLYWLGVAWATGRSPEPPRWQRFWSLLSDVSFGVYLIHPLILGPIMSDVVPNLPTAIPAGIRSGMVWGAAAILTVLACALMLYVPGASRLIGRPRSRVGGTPVQRLPARAGAGHDLAPRRGAR